MIGKVGNDAFGRLLIKTLKGAGIDTRGMLVSDDVFTTLAFVTLDDSGNREFSFARKPGADTQLRFDEIDLGVIDASKVLHFGTLSMTNEPARDATYKAVEYAAGRGSLSALTRISESPCGTIWTRRSDRCCGDSDTRTWSRSAMKRRSSCSALPRKSRRSISLTASASGSSTSPAVRRAALQDEDGLRLCQGAQRHSREGHDRSGRYLRRFCDVRAAESGRCTGEADRGGT